MTQAEQLTQLRSSIGASRRLAEEMRMALTPGMLLWAPLEGGWTIGQVFEHLVLTHESYRGRLRSLVERGQGATVAVPEGSPAETLWQPSLIGGWLIGALKKPGKLPAPGVFRPAAQPRTDVVGAYLERLLDTETLLVAAGGLEWQRLRLSSPVSPLFRMNLGDAVTILVVHDERHLRQIERVRAQPGFPKRR